MNLQFEHEHNKFKKDTAVSLPLAQSPANSKIKKEKQSVEPSESVAIPQEHQ